MKKRHFLKHPVVIFVLAQLAWLSLVGIWIYWYISNYIIFELAEDKVSPQLVSKSLNLFALITGLFLLVAVLTGMYMIFIYLNKQLHLTKLYDNFIGNVTQELKSPLASIQLYLETMNIRKVPRAKQKEFFALMMKDATGRMIEHLKRKYRKLPFLGLYAFSEIGSTETASAQVHGESVTSLIIFDKLLID